MSFASLKINEVETQLRKYALMTTKNEVDQKNTDNLATLASVCLTSGGNLRLTP